MQKAGKANIFARRNKRLDQIYSIRHNSIPRDSIPRFYIRAEFSRTSKSSLKKIRKRYFLDAKVFLTTYFFLLFIITFCIGFTRTEKNYVKVIDNDICNKEIEFKTKSETMKMNRSYKKLTRKYGGLKCKGIVALRDFLYKV